MKHRFIRALAIAALAAGNFASRTSAAETGRDSAAQAPVFLPFDFYPRHREELGLNEEQVREMQRLADGMREAAQKLEAERAGRTKALQEVMQRNPTDMDKAMDCFRAVLEAENELKALQFRSGIAMRNALTPEQFGKMQPLATKESASRAVGAAAKLYERLQQLRAEVHKRTGGEPPRELVEAIKKIEQATKDGRLADAKDQLEQLLRSLRDESGSALSADATRSDDLKQTKAKTEKQMRSIKEQLEHTNDPELRERLQGALKGLSEAAESGNHEALGKIMKSIEPALRDASRGGSKGKE